MKLSIPLGPAETTWRVAFVGVPDGLGPASTTASVASDLPLSLRVDAGAKWVEGDVVETHVLVRNRSDAAVHATVEATAEGAATLEHPVGYHEASQKPGGQPVDVPAHGARTVRVKVRAQRSGEGRLVLVARAPGLPDDVLRHTWEIAPAGEARALTQTAWVDGERALGLALDPGYRIAGAPRLVLERGYDDAVAAALESLEPESQKSAHALVDSLEAGTRIQRWALAAKDTPRHRALAAIAEGQGARALGRYHALVKLGGPVATNQGSTASAMWALQRRAELLTRTPGVTPVTVAAGPGGKPQVDPTETCPPDYGDVRASFASSSVRSEDEEVLDLEPAPGPSVPPCGGAYVSAATRALQQDSDPERVAIALIALAERPQHNAVTQSLADHLRRLVKLDPSGDIDGRARGAGIAERARRATIYAALLRTQRYGSSAATADALFGRLATLRDVTGGYGSSRATVAVVRALLSSQLESHGTTRVHVGVARSGAVAAFARDVEVPESGFIVVPLPASTLDVSVQSAGPGVVARFERPVLRLWTHPPPPQESPVGLDVVWPTDSVAGLTGTLRLTVRHSLDSAVVIDTRVPLPPGVTLGAPTNGAAQVQGVLVVRQATDRNGTVIEIPLRFGLAGKMTVPEATARIARSSSAPATAPARALLVR